MNDYILIEYSNSTDFGDILYQNTFVNRIYLDADVSTPEYELVEDGEENGDGEFFPSFQKWSKKYSITFYAQEFLVDAITLMALHDQINITLKNGESSNVKDIEVDPTWDSNIECWAEVVITFSTMYITRVGCDENMETTIVASVTADDVYDADDGGAGSARWANPQLYPEQTSFFYINTADGEYVGGTGQRIGFYKSTNGEWVSISLADGSFGGVTAFTDAEWLYKISDYQYQRVPYITSVTDETGGVAKVTVVSSGIEGSFLQLQQDTGGGFADIGDPLVAGSWGGGHDVTVGAGVGIVFRVYCYTHSADYGYSNEVTQTIT